jgi:hypothetical protein
MKYKELVVVMLMSSVFNLAFESVATAADQAPTYASLVTDLQACSLNKPDAVRLNCFDSLLEKFEQGDGDQIKVVGQLPENIGGGKFDTRSDKEQVSRGVVISCNKAGDGKWLFVFANEQVWKQVNKDNRRYNYKDCKFNVSVKKDGFGYKMKIDEENREIRIKRYK